jgi:hypothetical protein
MSTQSNSNPPGLWERKTYASALISAFLAAVAAVSVCAVRGETLALPPVLSGSVSHGHTDTVTAGGK